MQLFQSAFCYINLYIKIIFLYTKWLCRNDIYATFLDFKIIPIFLHKIIFILQSDFYVEKVHNIRDIYVIFSRYI